MTSINQRIRQSLLAQRRGLSAAQLDHVAHAVRTKVGSQQAYRSAETWGVYWAHAGECDPRYLVAQAWRDHKRCYLPVVQPGGLLRWVAYHQDSEMQPNRYGIMEPVVQDDVIDPCHLDVVLVPLVACNAARQRMGYGQGYFDRCFAFRRQSSQPILWGLAYAWQCCEDWQAHAGDLVCDDIFCFS